VAVAGEPLMPYDAETLAAFLRRSYAAVDGLWFMKVEETADFDCALELDRQVWEVMAKIQARKARELLGATGNSPEELGRCFALKFEAEGHDFELARAEDTGVELVIRDCAWLQLTRKSGREHLAGRVGEMICAAEGAVWGREFGGYGHSMVCRMCTGDEVCRHLFRRPGEER